MGSVLRVRLPDGAVIDIPAIMGAPGKDGKDGEQGIQGEKGEQGEQGIQGPKGDDGYTPVKGIDYWTEDDKAHNDERIRDIAEEVIEAADIKSDEVWAAPIVVGVTASRFELDVPEDAPLGAVVVPEGSEAESIKMWGKNYFHNDTGTAFTVQGVTAEWDSENQEFVFNGTTISSGDFKLVNPLDIDWVPGEKYTMSVKQTGGTATLGAGSSGTTYAWGIFQNNAAKYIRGSTSNTSFVEDYSFVATAYELDAARTHILYFQCWRPGTVFDNYRVKIQVENGNVATEWEPYRETTAAIADAPEQMLHKGVNHIMTVPSGEITIGQIEDTKTYIDRVVDRLRAELMLIV